MFLTSSTGSVVLDPALSRVVITVRQNGSPSGTISFLGEAQMTQRVDEGSTLSLQLERDGDFSTAVDVNYRVFRVSGDGSPVLLDVTPATGTVSFPTLQGRASLDLMILADEVAEPDETLTVELTGTSGGASINPQANTATFIIKLVAMLFSTSSCDPCVLLVAMLFSTSSCDPCVLLCSANGELFGEYGIVNASLSASSVGGSTVRTLTYTVVRRGGDLIGSNITVQHGYSQVCPPFSGYVCMWQLASDPIGRIC